MVFNTESAQEFGVKNEGEMEAFCGSLFSEIGTVLMVAEHAKNMVSVIVITNTNR